MPGTRVAEPIVRGGEGGTRRGRDRRRKKMERRRKGSRSGTHTSIREAKTQAKGRELTRAGACAQAERGPTTNKCFRGLGPASLVKKKEGR